MVGGRERSDKCEASFRAGILDGHSVRFWIPYFWDSGTRDPAYRSHLVRAIHLGGITLGPPDRHWGYRAGAHHLGGCAMCRRESKWARLSEQLHGSRFLNLADARGHRRRVWAGVSGG